MLDVGCGTAILSMFAARGGAASVVGIDGSPAIARYAQANVQANGLAAAAGGPVTIVPSKVEELAELPAPAGAAGEQQAQQAQRVDVLVSEWMGYALLFESMLDSVLHARDRWLRPGGAMLPDVARLYVAAASEAASGLDFWRDVYGFRWVGWGARGVTLFSMGKGGCSLLPGDGVHQCCGSLPLCKPPLPAALLHR